MKDDAQARKARAESLRKQIARITDPKAGEGEESQDEHTPSQPSQGKKAGTKPPTSPRDFIHRRMSELDKKKS